VLIVKKADEALSRSVCDELTKSESDSKVMVYIINYVFLLESAKDTTKIEETIE
jgi:hypothetical protein